jgi:hypothetical protein
MQLRLPKDVRAADYNIPQPEQCWIAVGMVEFAMPCMM